MTLSVQSDHLAPDLGSDQEGPRKPGAPPLTPGEFARWIWRQLTSMRTALILLFLLAIAAIPGSLIPQTPVDPSAVFAFQQRHPQLTPLFDRVGMFHVYSSVWFSAIYLLLMLSLIGCIIPRLKVYAKACRNRPPKAPRNLSRLSAYDVWETTSPRAIEARRARRLLAGQRRRIQIYEDDAETVVSAEKGYLREAGNLLFHCAVVVVLIGVAVTGLFGFKSSPMLVAVGSTWCSNSSRFGATSTFNCDAPVRLPPGRARLATRPSSTGSVPMTKTIGVVELAFSAAIAGGMPNAAIKSTLRPTRSPANPGRRS